MFCFHFFLLSLLSFTGHLVALFLVCRIIYAIFLMDFLPAHHLVLLSLRQNTYYLCIPY